ncbi:MAG: hypothetical protein HFI37_01230 [Lachnospiraceae bacterium]|nr:hypothetical protein [Lachnospiraceae bacterium]
MRCKKCGAKLKAGCVYCSVCGEAAQMVPDYNLEEDYLKFLLQEGGKKKSIRKKEESSEKKKKRIYLGLVIAALTATIIFLIGLFFVQDQSYDGQVKKAERSYGKKEYDKAAMYAKKALKRNAGGIKAHIILGKCYLEKGEIGTAKEYLEYAFSISNSNIEICRLLIEVYEADRDYPSITKLYSKVKKKEIKKLFADYMVETPKIEPKGGTYDEYPDITLSAENGLTIYYTLDGSNPKAGGILYEEPFSLEEEGEIEVNAICVDKRGIFSSKVTQNYTIQLNIPDLPTATPESGTYIQATQITIDVPENCRAYYAWNSTPNANASRYTGPFEMIQGNNVLSIILVNENGQTSGIQKYNYIYMP